MAKVPKDKELIAARIRFRELLESRSPESVWQNFLAENPYVLSLSLPLKLLPCDILAKGRPGRSEPDFLIYPGSAQSQQVYGIVELKTPATKILTERRKSILDITSDARTAIRQLEEYERNFDRYAPKPRVLRFGSRSYQFLLIGNSLELFEVLSDRWFREQAEELLPRGVELLTFDQLLENYERRCPKQLVLAVPVSHAISRQDERLGPSTHWVSAREIRRALLALGCDRVKSGVKGVTKWRNQSGEHFYVPQIGVDGSCPADVFAVVDEVVRSSNYY